MKIMIMKSSRIAWYKNKIGKTFKVQIMNEKGYRTKDGFINKDDAVVIEK